MIEMALDRIHFPAQEGEWPHAYVAIRLGAVVVINLIVTPMAGGRLQLAWPWLHGGGPVVEIPLDLRQAVNEFALGAVWADDEAKLRLSVM